jgi:phosphoribosylaminoimidazole-succinocarboxamide synthase
MTRKRVIRQCSGVDVRERSALPWLCLHPDSRCPDAGAARVKGRAQRDRAATRRRSALDACRGGRHMNEATGRGLVGGSDVSCAGWSVRPLGVELTHSGKVRDVYRAGPGELFLVASDRVSVYDVVLPTPIPDKGRLLTQLSLWWFRELGHVVPNHVVSAEDVPDEWRGRAIRCREVEIVQVECIARGYLAGLGWDAYRESGAVSGVSLPAGLREGDRLPEAVFTPTTKTAPEDGHDEPMTFDEVAAQVGAGLAAKLRDTTLALYREAAAKCLDRGLILADTKFEFGVVDGSLILADEVLTSDSSRYWRLDDWKPGQRQLAFDKQYVRDWASDLGWWDKKPPGPEVPDDVVEETRRRYVELYEMVTGLDWS